MSSGAKDRLSSAWRRQWLMVLFWQLIVGQLITTVGPGREPCLHRSAMVELRPIAIICLRGTFYRKYGRTPEMQHTLCFLHSCFAFSPHNSKVNPLQNSSLQDFRRQLTAETVQYQQAAEYLSATHNIVRLGAFFQIHVPLTCHIRLSPFTPMAVHYNQ